MKMFAAVIKEFLRKLTTDKRCHLSERLGIVVFTKHFLLRGQIKPETLTMFVFSY